LNQGELALIFCLIFLHLASRGPGRLASMEA
jgi:hypothetical protein